MQICSLPRDVVYYHAILQSGKYMPLNNDWYAIVDCSESGQLKSEYCLVKKLHFYSSESTSLTFFLLTCSCKDSLPQTNRLITISSIISKDVWTFKSREEAQYCIHRVTISKLHSSKNLTLHSSPVDQDDELDQVVVLSFNPLCIAVISGRCMP